MEPRTRRPGRTTPFRDWVEGMLGWQTHARVHHSVLRKLDLTLAPPSTAIGVLGMPGRTAWFGLMESGRPKAGEVVVVSGAAGAVGSLVAQFALRSGCRVLGIAGGAIPKDAVIAAAVADDTPPSRRKFRNSP